MLLVQERKKHVQENANASRTIYMNVANILEAGRNRHSRSHFYAKSDRCELSSFSFCARRGKTVDSEDIRRVSHTQPSRAAWRREKILTAFLLEKESRIKY